jgi:hypothetical protein
MSVHDACARCDAVMRTDNINVLKRCVHDIGLMTRCVACVRYYVCDINERDAMCDVRVRVATRTCAFNVR